jgi:hypothetical protein
MVAVLANEGTPPTADNGAGTYGHSVYRWENGAWMTESMQQVTWPAKTLAMTNLASDRFGRLWGENGDFGIYNEMPFFEFDTDASPTATAVHYTLQNVTTGGAIYVAVSDGNGQSSTVVDDKVSGPHPCKPNQTLTFTATDDATDTTVTATTQCPALATNHPPTVKLTASASTCTLPKGQACSIELSASLSDADPWDSTVNSPLKYQWSGCVGFSGQVMASGTTGTVHCMFFSAGTQTATLTVTDQYGGKTTKSVTLHGVNAPSPTGTGSNGSGPDQPGSGPGPCDDPGESCCKPESVGGVPYCDQSIHQTLGCEVGTCVVQTCSKVGDSCCYGNTSYPDESAYCDGGPGAVLNCGDFGKCVAQ